MGQILIHFLLDGKQVEHEIQHFFFFFLNDLLVLGLGLRMFCLSHTLSDRRYFCHIFICTSISFFD